MSEQPDQQRQPSLRASDADRERVASVLNSAMAEGRITLAELEERLDQVYAAKTVDDLKPVTADLPAPGVEVASRPSAQVPTPHDLIGGRPGSTFSIAVMSGADRKGNWVVPGQHNAFAFWGGVEIDLRRARFAEQQTTICAVAIMGGVDVIVPDDIRVEVSGIGIMGGFDSQGEARDDIDPNGPVVTVNGLAFWGGVTVKRKPRHKRGDKRLPPADNPPHLEH